MLKKIIDPVSVEKIEAELTRDKFLRDTNNANREIYIITYKIKK